MGGPQNSSGHFGENLQSMLENEWLHLGFPACNLVSITPTISWLRKNRYVPSNKRITSWKNAWEPNRMPDNQTHSCPKNVNCQVGGIKTFDKYGRNVFNPCVQNRVMAQCRMLMMAILGVWWTAHCYDFITTLWTNKYSPRWIIFTQPAGPQIAKKFLPLCEYQWYISSFVTAPNSPYPQPDNYSPRPVTPQPLRSNLITFHLWLGLPSSLFP